MEEIQGARDTSHLVYLLELNLLVDGQKIKGLLHQFKITLENSG